MSATPESHADGTPQSLRRFKSVRARDSMAPQTSSTPQSPALPPAVPAPPQTVAAPVTKTALTPAPAPVPAWAYEHKLLIVLASAMLLSCIGSPFPDQMWLQHSPTVFLLFFLPWITRRYPLSRTSFTCFITFMLLHTLGARYIYSYVPYDDWCQTVFGFRPTDAFHFRRNHYDRLVHLSFGLLWTVPAYEVFTRYCRLSAKASRYFAIEFILAASIVYELFEWGLTLVLSPHDAGEYNGQQGDLWDSQKDVTMAMLGSFITMGILWWRQRSLKAAEPKPKPDNILAFPVKSSRNVK